MRSIRWSLIVYFLVLLAFALGTVSVFVYSTTSQAMEKKEASRRDLLETQYQDRCKKEREKFDEGLLSEARTLASLVNFQFLGNRNRYQSLYPLGALTAGLNPSGYAVVPLWVAEGSRTMPLDRGGRPTDYYARRTRSPAAEIHLDEDVLRQSPEGGPDWKYLQINTEMGSMWRSHAMLDLAFSFPAMDSMPAELDAKFDDTSLPNGTNVRRVVLKAPVSRFRVARNAPPPRGRPPGRRPSVPPTPQAPAGPERFTERASPALFIHCAAETASLDNALARHKDNLDEQLEEVRQDSKDSLAALRLRLGLIGMTAFAAALAGAFFLIWLGLSPLHRLSEAVSQVSEKDFSLRCDQESLPNELRPIAERLSQTLELLRQAFAREKQAAADLSHELRTPLTCLLTTTELALRKPRTGDEYREMLEECHQVGLQMGQLVERLLALARLDAGVDPLRAAEVDVAFLAEQSVALVRPLAEARELKLRLHSSQPIPFVADPDKLREVLNNLLHNAIEYNRPNGCIDLTVARENGHLKVEVRDTGIGITPEARAHIFERFYRADPSRHTEGTHAGLGLAIVKGFVDLMGGSIDVESTAGKGSTFRVRLPAAATKA